MCPEHRDLCAYTGREPDRCPVCHCLLSHIAVTNYHSCDSQRIRDSRSGRRARREKARQKAAQGLDGP